MQELLKMCLLGLIALLIQQLVSIFYRVKAFNTKIIVLVNGGWGEWTQWSPCQKDCQKYRFRGCVNPYPANGGRDCVGDNNQNEKCCPGLMIITSSQIDSRIDYRIDSRIDSGIDSRIDHFL